MDVPLIMADSFEALTAKIIVRGMREIEEGGSPFHFKSSTVRSRPLSLSNGRTRFWSINGPLITVVPVSL